VLKTLKDQLKACDKPIVFSLDRRGRRAAEFLTLPTTLEKLAVNLNSQCEGLNFRSAVCVLVLIILTTVAVMECELKGRLVKAEIASSKASGGIGCRPSTNQSKTSIEC